VTPTHVTPTCQCWAINKGQAREVRYTLHAEEWQLMLFLVSSFTKSVATRLQAAIAELNRTRSSVQT
jgi:hypothetical protein